MTDLEPALFERFTDRARRVVVLAQEEARQLDHNYIGTEHLLLGLVHEGEGVAAQALGALRVDVAAVRTEVTDIIGKGGSTPSGHIPFTPRAKKVLELSLREALQLGHNYIGTEHILLGLIREGEGVAAQVLIKLGASLSSVRQGVIALLSGYAGATEPAAAVTVQAVRARLTQIDSFEAPFTEVLAAIPAAALAVVPDTVAFTDTEGTPIAGRWYVRADGVTYGLGLNASRYTFAPVYGDSPREACVAYLAYLRGLDGFTVPAGEDEGGIPQPNLGGHPGRVWRWRDPVSGYFEHCPPVPLEQAVMTGGAEALRDAGVVGEPEPPAADPVG